MSFKDELYGRRRLVILAAAVVLVFGLIGSFVFIKGTTGVEDNAVVQSLGSQRPGNSQTIPPLKKSEPTSISIPKISAQSTLVSLGLNADNTVEVPPVSQPLQAGWYSYGPTPGELGPAVILGHVDGNKSKGIFYRLKELSPGDEVSVTRKDGSTATFVVYRMDQVTKDSFPTEQVYGNTAGPELRLITCGGSFNHAAHSYRDNIVVYLSLKP